MIAAPALGAGPLCAPVGHSFSQFRRTDKNRRSARLEAAEAPDCMRAPLLFLSNVWRISNKGRISGRRGILLGLPSWSRPCSGGPRREVQAAESNQAGQAAGEALLVPPQVAVLRAACSCGGVGGGGSLPFGRPSERASRAPPRPVGPRVSAPVRSLFASFRELPSTSSSGGGERRASLSQHVHLTGSGDCRCR